MVATDDFFLSGMFMKQEPDGMGAHGATGNVELASMRYDPTDFRTFPIGSQTALPGMAVAGEAAPLYANMQPEQGQQQQPVLYTSMQHLEQGTKQEPDGRRAGFQGSPFTLGVLRGAPIELLCGKNALSRSSWHDSCIPTHHHHHHFV